MSGRTWDAIIGIRRDIDLNQRWWHRLAKVAYFLIAGIVIAIFAFILWDASSGDSFPAQRKQVTVITSLGKELSDADDSVPNVVPIFLKKDGRLGYDDGSKYLDWMSGDYELDDTLCSPAPLKHTEVIAAFLKEHRSMGARSVEEVASEIVKDLKPEHATDVCWMQSGLRGKSMDKIIKYEFTTTGLIGALWDYSYAYIAWMVGIDLVLRTIYYRGIVFVIVGPRKKVAPPKHDDDDDIDDIDDD